MRRGGEVDLPKATSLICLVGSCVGSGLAGPQICHQCFELSGIGRLDFFEIEDKLKGPNA